MGKAPNHKVTNRRAKRSEKVPSCNKQFPDCPTEPNKDDCRTCPFFKK